MSGNAKRGKTKSARANAGRDDAGALRPDPERFAASTLRARDGSDRAFELELARSGRIVAVPAGQSAAHTLEAAGVTVPMSCGQGVCGTGLPRVLAGMPDHRDDYLTAEERAGGDPFLPCSSRALSPRLVLDL